MIPPDHDGHLDDEAGPATAGTGAGAATSEFVTFFRQASPYIHAHRGSTVVCALPGAQVARPDIVGLVHDLALLASLGIRLVVVHGARHQIARRIEAAGVAPRIVDGVRVTDAAALPHVCDGAASVRLQLEALFSQGLPNSPMDNARLRVASGNFVVARPLGVKDGVDFGYTGVVRRVDVEAIRGRLAAGDIVLLSPIGYSATGEVFNLEEGAVAVAVSGALRAEKLVFLTDFDPTRVLGDAQPVREVTHDELSGRVAGLNDPTGDAAGPPAELQAALKACRQGVERVHLVPGDVPGAILEELFSRDGAGLLVGRGALDSQRKAQVDDVAGILELIRPLEEDGTLVRRSRDKLESEVDRFTLVLRDGAIIACAALYPLSDTDGEVACLVVHPDYDNGGYGSALLKRLEADALEQGLSRLLVLTTRASHWFLERGFAEGRPDDLPDEKRRLYNYQRNSKVYLKPLIP